MQIHWVFTETGHGKGPADGIGATMKTEIDNIVSYNPNKSIKRSR